MISKIILKIGKTKFPKAFTGAIRIQKNKHSVSRNFTASLPVNGLQRESIEQQHVLQVFLIFHFSNPKTNTRLLKKKKKTQLSSNLDYKINLFFSKNVIKKKKMTLA